MQEYHMSEIPNYKRQITNKFQNPNLKQLEFESWSLEFIGELVIGIYCPLSMQSKKVLREKGVYLRIIIALTSFKMSLREGIID